MEEPRDQRPSGPPLGGIKVVDITTSYAGPVASMYLADLGADVIKIERPGGDDTRHWGPPFRNGESAWFLSANRGKRSACVDISSEAGHEVLMRALADADVFIQNVSPGKLERLRIEPERLRKMFPRLIYCAISGFGLSGPQREKPGYDLIAQARSGLMSVTGEPGRLPQRMSTALSDVAAGTQAALAISAALVRQQKKGVGELIDVALVEADLAMISPRIAAFLMGAPEPQPSGGTDSVLSVYQGFATADRPIVIAVGNDRMWLRFCAALDLPDLAADERLRTNAGRVEHRARVIAAVSERMLMGSAAKWLEKLGEYGIPCSLIHTLSEVVADPQIRAREAIDISEHPVAGEVELVSAPWRMESLRPPRPSPACGEHGEEILAEIGYDEAEIERLVEAAAVALPASGSAPADRRGRQTAGA